MPDDRIVLDHYAGPVVRVGGLCYTYNQRVVDPPVHEAEKEFLTCVDCQEHHRYVRCSNHKYVLCQADSPSSSGSGSGSGSSSGSSSNGSG